jgi:hypothetical protein
MSENGNYEAIAMEAGADLSGKQYHIMRLAGVGIVNQASHAAAAPQIGVIGVLVNKPAASGRDATIAIAGEIKVVAGAAVTAGKWITSNSSGRGVVAASGDLVAGRALETSANDGEYIRCLLDRPWKLVGTN